MKEEVFKIHKYAVGHRINRQLLLSLEDVFKQYNKNKIEICLKNFRLNYRVLSAIPIMPILLTATFIVICVYTGKRDIVFPTIVQRLIIGIWLGGSFLLVYCLLLRG